MAIASPGAVPLNLTPIWDPESGSWGVWNDDNGTMLQTGLTEQEATLLAQDLSTDPNVVLDNMPQPGESPLYPQAAAEKALLQQAKEQANLQQRYNQTTRGDWRVKLQLGADTNYLYQDPNNTLLAPLRVSGGIVFPYTPTVSTNYRANYNEYDLVHSNYKGYFYKNSAVSDINITGTFTAQDTNEAKYVLAVIHFFKSASKMFYGKDQERGTPPPLMYLSGYGEYQFNGHPCVLSNFQYSLPNDVDYIPISPNNQGLNLAPRNNLTSGNPGTISEAVDRLKTLYNLFTQQPGIPKGAVGAPADLGVVQQTVTGTGSTTYVPTKIDITITLLPIQTRSQVSGQFSLKDFANGNLLRGGFW